MFEITDMFLIIVLTLITILVLFSYTILMYIDWRLVYQWYDTITVNKDLIQIKIPI